jgi:beta-lactamase class D
MRLTVAYFFVLLFAFSCSPDNIKKDNSLKKYFDENKVDGCFALMNNATGNFTVYNFERYKDSAYTPASTFKIVNSLIGLQTGRIVNDSMVIKWDGKKRWNEEWNKDLQQYLIIRKWQEELVKTRCNTGWIV